MRTAPPARAITAARACPRFGAGDVAVHHHAVDAPGQGLPSCASDWFGWQRHSQWHRGTRDGLAASPRVPR
jgi:hypothetical protein